MQNLIPKNLDKALVFPNKKTGYLLKKFKTLTNAYKRVFGIFFKFCLDLEILIKLVSLRSRNQVFFDFGK